MRGHGPLSADLCHHRRRATPSGLIAEYEGVPFGRPRADYAPSPGARYGFPGAVFGAFPHDDRRLRLTVDTGAPLPAEPRRLLEGAIREVAAARGRTGGRDD
jgi:hypothetical protein